MTVTFYFVRHGETLFNVQNRVQGWCDTALTSSGLYDAYRLGQHLTEVDFVGACVSDAGRAQETLSVALEARENERMRLRARATIIDSSMKADAAANMVDRGIVDPREQVSIVEQYLRAEGRLRPHTLTPDSRGLTIAERRIALAEGWRPDPSELDLLDYPACSIALASEDMLAAAPVPVRVDARLREWCFGDLEGEPALRMRNRLFDLFGDDVPREEQNRHLDEIADYLASRDESHRAENFAAITARIQSFLEDCGRSVERSGGGNVLAVTHALLIRAVVFLYANERVGDTPKVNNGSVTEVIWDDGKISVGHIGADPKDVFPQAR